MTGAVYPFVRKLSPLRESEVIIEKKSLEDRRYDRMRLTFGAHRDLNDLHIT